MFFLNILLIFSVFSLFLLSLLPLLRPFYSSFTSFLYSLLSLFVFLLYSSYYSSFSFFPFYSQASLPCFYYVLIKANTSSLSYSSSIFCVSFFSSEMIYITPFHHSHFVWFISYLISFVCSFTQIIVNSHKRMPKHLQTCFDGRNDLKSNALHFQILFVFTLSFFYFVSFAASYFDMWRHRNLLIMLVSC